MTDPTYSRRQMLAGGVGGLSLLSASRHVRARGSDTVRRAAATRAAGTDLGAVEHVVFLMQENRSFDHYFGTMKGVRGFDDSRNRRAFTQAWPGGSRSSLLPFPLTVTTQQAECTYDLDHSWPSEHASWHGGTMERFVATHTSPAYEGALGITTMGYYTEADLPFYYRLAEQFTVCDRYFCSVLGPTHPNRLMQMTGTIDPDGRAGGPILTTNDSQTQFAGTCSWTTMPEVLQDAGVTWKAYNPYGPNYQPGASYFASKNMLLYFARYQDPASALYRNAFGYCGPNVVGGLTGGVGPDDFARDVANDTLPQVSWILSPDTYDEHPPAPPALGEWYTHRVLDTLLSNPKVWARTVLFIMYDENDGFFDHVPPPTPPPGTPGEELTTDPLPPAAGGVAGPIGLGVRVPMLVVSPFSVGGYVNSEVADHTSQLRFLEARFGVRAPNISAWRRSVTGDLTSTLPVLHAPDTRPPDLPATSASTTTGVVGTECTTDQLLELNTPVTPFSVPRHQRIPAQAPGTLKPIRT